MTNPGHNTTGQNATDKNSPGQNAVVLFCVRKNADTFENTRQDSQMLPTADINILSLSVLKLLLLYTNRLVILICC